MFVIWSFMAYKQISPVLLKLLLAFSNPSFQELNKAEKKNKIVHKRTTNFRILF